MLQVLTIYGLMKSFKNRLKERIQDTPDTPLTINESVRIIKCSMEMYLS